MSDGTSGDELDDDLSTLFPERELEIQGETITIIPISFLEGVRLSPMIQPLIDDIAAVFDGDENPDIDLLMHAFVNHEAVFVKLESMCCGKDEEWIKGLPDNDGYSLALVFWAVNSSFFIRRLLAPKINGMVGSETSSSESSLQH